MWIFWIDKFEETRTKPCLLMTNILSRCNPQRRTQKILYSSKWARQREVFNLTLTQIKCTKYRQIWPWLTGWKGHSDQPINIAVDLCFVKIHTRNLSVVHSMVMYTEQMSGAYWLYLWVIQCHCVLGRCEVHTDPICRCFNLYGQVYTDQWKSIDSC